MHMRATLQSGVVCNGQQAGRAVNSFIDQAEFVAMKILGGRKAPQCDKHQGRKEDLERKKERKKEREKGRKKEIMRKNDTYMSLNDHKVTQRGRLGA